MFGKRFSRALAVTTVASLVMAVGAFASEVDVAVVDVTAPTGSVSLTAGGASGAITINLSVTGNQAGTATFEVYRNWTLSGGTFTGSNPQEFTVSPRAGGDPATSFSTTGSVSVAAGQAAGAFTLAVGAFDITNSNATGAKLAAGDPSNYAVTVVSAPTNTAPTLSLPANMTVEGNILGGANVTYTATANDTQDGALTPSCSPASGSFFALGGPHAVSCSVTDSGNLSTNGSFTITVIDTTDPVVSGPADATIEGNTTGGATQTSGLAALGSATATDTVSGDVSASITNDAPTTFPLGPTTVTYTAVDGAGNSGTTSAVLTVEDTTAPTISGTPANITTTTMNAGGKVVTYTAPTASDIVDSSVPVNCSPASGSTFSIGTTTVTCTATDDSLNTAQSSFTVQVSLLTAQWKEPINGPSVVNVAKAGRVIPAKVEIFVDGVENVDTGSVTFKLWKSNSCAAAAQDAIETFVAVGEAAGGSAYVWNADGGFYQYNLKTSTTPGCYRGEAYLNGELAGYFLINATK